MSILRICTLCVNVSPFAYSCIVTIYIQVYRPLPPGGNPIAANKYLFISHHFISHHFISHHFTMSV